MGAGFCYYDERFSELYYATLNELIIPESTGDRTADVATLTQRVYADMERVIRQRPEQWYMFRPFWPSEPAGQPASAPDPDLESDGDRRWKMPERAPSASSTPSAPARARERSRRSAGTRRATCLVRETAPAETGGSRGSIGRSVWRERSRRSSRCGWRARCWRLVAGRHGRWRARCGGGRSGTWATFRRWRLIRRSGGGRRARRSWRCR